MLARVLSNGFTKEYLEMEKSGASADELRNFLSQHDQYHSQCLGNSEGAEICCGQVAGLIKQIDPAGKVMEEIIGNIDSRMKELAGKLPELA